MEQLSQSAPRQNLRMNEFPLMEPAQDNIVLFYPHVPKTAAEEVTKILSTRWVGQGPQVEAFEQEFTDKIAPQSTSIAVGSGTDALHLAYILGGLEAGDEVVTPLFTCTATNIPLLYMGVKAVFADVQRETLNIDPDDVRRRITPRTKALVCVHYGGLPCDMDALQAIADEHGLLLIEDAAHALGATYKGRSIGGISDFTIFSFQAIKHITTGDGGMLLLKDPDMADQARRLRWFGIDRRAKQKGIWENDITDEHGLRGVTGLEVVGAAHPDRTHAAWICTVLAENREGLQRKLRDNHIESAQVHYRNDRYSIFGGRRTDFPNMDAVEDRYLVLPLHSRMGIEQVQCVCSVIREGW
jgi:dTDP-4-amino-4,6-dideoxygalactose transaminase